MSKATIYTLKHPLELTNSAGQRLETITELRLRRLKGRDLDALDKATGNGSSVIALVAASADLPPSTVRELDAEDVTAAGALVADFLGGSLPTGATLSPK